MRDLADEASAGSVERELHPGDASYLVVIGGLEDPSYWPSRRGTLQPSVPGR